MAPVIGVFDSGFGGLTVLRELRRVLPAADYLYFGDTAHLPYGAKSVRTVAKYAIAAAHFLEQHGIELLVVACNTATALAFDEIAAAVSAPVVGVVKPGAQRAAAISKTRNVAVIATEATVSSHAYQRALQGLGLQATEKACPLFVPLVEEGWVEHPVTEQVAHIYMDEVFRNGARDADVLVLGCTHYPLLRPLLRRVVPSRVEIVDSAESTADKVVELLKNKPDSSQPGRLRCYATDSVEKFRRLGGKFLGCPIEQIELVDIEKS
ncbi:MAG TPA: glutamate racemase [Candidatus Sulfotelmatobacter sp.]|nr:glutamate racemase [Candidatus Sulfotelmatobacter sp.]